MAVKGKAETKKKKETDDIEKFAVRLQNIAEKLRWDEREICEHTPEAQIVMHMIHLENRLETVAKNHDDLIDNLRIFIGKEEDEKSQ